MPGCRVMALLRVLLALCFVVVVLPAGAQPFQDLGWSRVANRRGAAVDFPGGLFTRETAAAPERMAFSTADGDSRFELFSIENVRHETPAEFVRRAANDHEGLDYKRVARNFIAASTIRSGRILYRRCNFVSGMIHCIDLRYPTAQKRAWDKIVTRISLSLRPR
jgi:hypothetical protein